MKTIKVKTKAGVGKFLRLASPTKRVIITNGEATLTEEEYNLVAQYVDVVKDKPRSYRTKVTTEESEKKSEENGE